jgi:hypothetical protein
MQTKNLPLIIGIALPIVFILGISVFLFVPSHFVDPQYDFIYTMEDRYYGFNDHGYRNTYKVEDGRIALEPLPTKEGWTYLGDMPVLYRYDVNADTAHQISFNEALELSLDPGPSSPDGYTVAYQYGHSGIFEVLGSNNDNSGYFISKGKAKKKLNGLTNDGYSSRTDSKFIGWIK